MTNLASKNIEVSTLNENTTLPENNLSTVSAQVPVHSAPFNERLDQAIRLHKDGLAGNVTAVQEANRVLERLRFDHPHHPLADAYHGSIMILIARDKTKPLEKLRWSKAGLKILDGAVSAAPQDGMIRLLRGKAAYKLPEKHFHRAQTAIEDYTFLIDQEMRQEGFLRTEEYSQLIYELGEAYCRIGRNQDAAMCWRKLEQQTQDSNFQHLLKQKLQSVEGKPAIEILQTTGSPTSILIGRIARATGSALQSWAEQEKEEEARRKRRRRKADTKARRSSPYPRKPDSRKRR